MGADMQLVYIYLQSPQSLHNSRKGHLGLDMSLNI